MGDISKQLFYNNDCSTFWESIWHMYRAFSDKSEKRLTKVIKM